MALKQREETKKDQQVPANRQNTSSELTPDGIDLQSVV